MPSLARSEPATSPSARKAAHRGPCRGRDPKGCRVAIIDDACTTGGSAIQAVDEVRKAGGEVVLALAVIDREEGAAANFRRHGLAFDALFRAHEFIPDDFERLPPAVP